MKIVCIVAVALILGPSGQALADPADATRAQMPSTLYGGDFDDYLMIAADREAKTLEGYYNDGKCRFAFRGALAPLLLDQREDFGEAYYVDSWDPARPSRHFITSIYSRARGGYQEQLTLELGERDEAKPSRCRSRITLDRSDNTDFIGVRVVRTPRAPVYRIGPQGGMPKLASHLPAQERLPAAGMGVWVAKTYSAAFSPKGFVSVAWYSPPGTPRGDYIRDRDLYPRPKPAQEAVP